MRFSIAGSLTALVALAAASPLQQQQQPNPIEARAVCTPPPTTTAVVGGVTTTLSGPFKLTASISGTAIPNINGKYAKFNSETFQNVVFGTVGSAANTFFLSSSGYLYGNNSGTIAPAYEYLYKTTPHVKVTDSAGKNALVTCTINTSSCALNCTESLNGGYQNFLASVTDQPDWAIAVDKKGCGYGCVPFQPYVVPAQKNL